MSTPTPRTDAEKQTLTSCIVDMQRTRIGELERDLAAARAEVDRLKAQSDNLLKPMRDQAIARAERAEAEVEKLREEAMLWEAKAKQLIAPHYILDPDLRADKFREALAFHPVLTPALKPVIDAAMKETT